MRLSSGAPVIENSKITTPGSASAFGIVAASATGADTVPITVTIANSTVISHRPLTANGASTPSATISLSDARATIALVLPMARSLSAVNGGVINVAHSLVVGPLDSANGTVRCFGAYGADYTDLTTDCTP